MLTSMSAPDLGSARAPAAPARSCSHCSALAPVVAAPADASPGGRALPGRARAAPGPGRGPLLPDGGALRALLLRAHPGVPQHMHPAWARPGGPASADPRPRRPGRPTAPHIAATRNRDQLYVYGYGRMPPRDGAFVASVDPARSESGGAPASPTAALPGQWSYPGRACSVHGNGFLYAIYGNVLVKLDPASGRTLGPARAPRPRPDRGGLQRDDRPARRDDRCEEDRTGALRDRRPGPPNPLATVGAFAGLELRRRPTRCRPCSWWWSRAVCGCSRRHTRARAGDRPHHLRPLGRTDYVYAAGRDSLFRFRYRRRSPPSSTDGGARALPLGAFRPGTGPGLLGGFLVVQTNFLPSTAPLTVTAVSVHDSRRVFRIPPFALPTAGGSWIVSKPALDGRPGRS